MCYFKSPFDTVYERGDSVALAAISGNVTFPESSPYNSVRSVDVLAPNSLKK
jgi:serine/threonine kinase 16